MGARARVGWRRVRANIKVERVTICIFFDFDVLIFGFREKFIGFFG